ncbi:MAG: NifB/NifX family molybdenum-iron cluster-binding protein [Deltaproteobacteria bacterium]|nr:NifB/NifX family molybdenum-iron cluster-binding protein [Deltaproteobacteria bacterium]
MRVAVSAQGDNLESEVDPRFGRASRFLIVDTDTMSFDVAMNDQNLNLPQGAGIQAAQNVAKHTPEVLLTGNCGPKAFRTLQAAGIKVVVGVEGNIIDAIKHFLDNKYAPTDEANVEGHWM